MQRSGIVSFAKHAVGSLQGFIASIEDGLERLTDSEGWCWPTCLASEHVLWPRGGVQCGQGHCSVVLASGEK